MISTIIWKLLELQLTLLIQVSSINCVFITTEMIQILYNLSLQISMVEKNNISKFCRIIGHKSYSCIIRGPAFIQTSFRQNMDQ